MNLLSLRRHSGLIAVTGLSILIASGSVLLMGQAIRALINKGISTQTLSAFNDQVLSLWGLVVLMSVASFVRLMATSTLGERLIKDIKSTLFGHVQTLDLNFFDQWRTGDLLTRLNKDTADLQAYITMVFPLTLRNGVLLIGALVMLFMTSVTLSLMTLCLIPLVLVPLVFLGKRLKRLSKQVQDNQSTLVSFTEESFASVETAKLFAHTAQTVKTYNDLLEATYKMTQERNYFRALLVFLVISLVFSGVCFVLWYGGHAVIAGTLSAGELTSFIFYAVIVAGTSNSLSESAGDFYQARAALGRLQELFTLSSKFLSGALRPPSSPQSLSLKNVSFGYTPDNLILYDVSFVIHPGEKIALVGPSGAGKSTLFKLLLRFYDPTAGCIELGHLHYRDLDVDALRHVISSVPQTPYIFATTVEENLRYANPQATSDQIVAAAVAADANDFIVALPQGYQTILGERGVTLSGGQRQRLALARVILRNPQILLLDEATNALDAESEHRIDEQMKKAFRDQTTVTIAHRFATVRDADRIIVLDKGKIQAIGTHDDLLQSSDLYRRLAELQFAHGKP